MVYISRYLIPKPKFISAIKAWLDIIVSLPPRNGKFQRCIKKKEVAREQST